jgi:lipoate synthase
MFKYRCGFCSVNKGVPIPLDPEEPRHIAEAEKTRVGTL